VTADLLRSAIRAARDAGMKWPEVYRIAATEYGAVFRESAIDGWVKQPDKETTPPPTKRKGKRR